MREPELRSRLAREGLSAQTWGNGPHDVYGQHRHGYDKVLVAAVGSITFNLPELKQDFTLEAGDRLDLPAETLHGAVVGPDGVTCLEAHLPAGSLAATPRRHEGWGGRDGG